LLPIDYTKFTNNILIELNLFKFLQISFDFAKNLRSFFTRINNKSKKRKGILVVSVVLLGSIIAYIISRLITKKGTELLVEVPELFI
jgi:hypothetical protein